MEQTTNTPQPSQPKHVKSFWAVTIILVMAAIAAGLVLWLNFRLSYEEDLNSIEFRIQRRMPADRATSTLPSGVQTTPTSAK